MGGKVTFIENKKCRENSSKQVKLNISCESEAPEETMRTDQIGCPPD